MMAKIIFRKPSDGGREHLPILDGLFYRPHIVLGNPNQSKPILNRKKGVIMEKYVGVSISCKNKSLSFGEEYLVEISFPYGAPAHFSKDSFTIREGVKIVGSGRFISSKINSKPRVESELQGEFC